jgi:hypothetical protein
MNTQININNYILLDRLSNMIDIYNTLIVDHTNDEEILSSEEKDQMSLVLGDLYQMVGDRICKLYEGENKCAE